MGEGSGRDGDGAAGVVEEDDRRRVAELVDYWSPLLVRMLAQSGVFAAFGRDARPVADVAAATGLDPSVLARVIRALAARGVFDDPGDGTARLSPLGRLLIPGEPGSMAGMAVFRPMDLHAWAEGLHSLRTGEPSFPVHFGHGHWEHLAADPELSAAFDRTMAVRTTTMLDLGLDRYAWPDTGVVVDLGGGNGLLLGRVLQRVPGLRGVLFDLPHVVASNSLAAAGVADRVEVVGGDLFVGELPTGGDLYVLASVLHDWDDAQAEQLLTRVRAVMGPGSRLVLFESVLTSGPEPDLGKQVDLHMLVLFGARERTAGDWRALLERAGFTVGSVTPTPGLAWIEAVPAPVTAVAAGD